MTQSLSDTMATTITIRGRKGQMLFFDEEDERVFVWACSQLPSMLANDMRTVERCGKATHIIVERDHAVVEVETWQWTADRIANFLCMVYDSYFRRRYKRSGKQSKYEIKRD